MMKNMNQIFDFDYILSKLLLFHYYIIEIQK